MNYLQKDMQMTYECQDNWESIPINFFTVAIPLSFYYIHWLIQISTI